MTDEEKKAKLDGPPSEFKEGEDVPNIESQPPPLEEVEAGGPEQPAQPEWKYAIMLQATEDLSQMRMQSKITVDGEELVTPAGIADAMVSNMSRQMEHQQLSAMVLNKLLNGTVTVKTQGGQDIQVPYPQFMAQLTYNTFVQAAQQEQTNELGRKIIMPNKLN